MENTNDGSIAAVDGVSASTDAATESQTVETQPTQDHFKNLKAELNRKLTKTNTELKAELAEMKQLILQSQSRGPAVEADKNSPDYKRYVDARFQEAQKANIEAARTESWNKALELFPELNQESEQFDEKFYKVADRYYGTFDLQRDTEAPLKAVKLAALEVGKIEQLTKEKLLKDEARRSRIISEGGSPSKDTKKVDKGLEINEGIARRLGANPETMKKLYQANKAKYER